MIRLLFLMCLLQSIAYAELKEVGSVKLDEKFQPYMLLSGHPGCPDNSKCTKKTGQLYTKAKEKNSKLVPIGFWINDESLSDEYPIVSWTSNCQAHQKASPSILKAEGFFSNFKEVQKIVDQGKGFKHQFLNERGQWISAPSGDSPIGFVGRSYYYTRELEGHYFGLLLTSNGSIKRVKPIKMSGHPEEVSCPENMKKLAQKAKLNESLYSGYYCKQIFDQTGKKEQIILIPWTCVK